MASPSQSKVYFFFDGVNPALRARTGLKAFIQSIFRKERKKLDSLVYVFSTDKKLLRINQKYLNRDYYTDIISFELSEKGSPIVGEIHISVDRVRENARNLKIPFKTELLRVMIHGSLHLCGYKDKNDRQRAQMQRKEDQYLTLFLRRFT